MCWLPLTKVATLIGLLESNLISYRETGDAQGTALSTLRIGRMGNAHLSECAVSAPQGTNVASDIRVAGPLPGLVPAGGTDGERLRRGRTRRGATSPTFPKPAEHRLWPMLRVNILTFDLLGSITIYLSHSGSHGSYMIVELLG